MMKNKLLYTLLCAILLIAACAPSNGQHKSLIGGIQSSSKQSAPETQQSEETEITEGTSDDLPDGLEIPITVKGNKGVILRRLGYTCSFNTERGVPNWVAWKLTADHTDGPYKRSGIKFSQDPDIPNSPDTYDYMRSGYDRGHMCPSADNRWSQEAQIQCFYMTNICPQEHSLNSGDWSELENKCRKWAEEHGAVYIVCGPIFYKGKPKTIGDHKVWVPNAFFKVVLTTDGKPQGCGFIYKNAEGNRPMGDYINSIRQVERITGIDFFSKLPDKIENKVESEVSIPN